MVDMNDPLPGSNVSFWTMAAALAGSLLSLRTLVESSPLGRMIAVASSWMVSFIMTPWVAEYFSLSLKAERAASLIIAFVGVNLLAGIGVFAGKFRESPTSAVEWLVSLWRGKQQ